MNMIHEIQELKRKISDLQTIVAGHEDQINIMREIHTADTQIIEALDARIKVLEEKKKK